MHLTNYWNFFVFNPIIAGYVKCLEHHTEWKQMKRAWFHVPKQTGWSVAFKLVYQINIWKIFMLEVACKPPVLKCKIHAKNSKPISVLKKCPQYVAFQEGKNLYGKNWGRSRCLFLQIYSLQNFVFTVYSASKQDGIPNSRRALWSIYQSRNIQEPVV